MKNKLNIYSIQALKYAVNLMKIYVLLMVIFLTKSLFASNSFNVKPECMVTRDKVVFHLLFNIEYKILNGKKSDSKGKEIYQFSCSRKNKSCDGVKVNLTDNTITYLGLSSIQNAKLVLDKGSVFIIEWGTFRVFKFDISKNEVEYRESGQSALGLGQVEGFAKSKCD